MFCFSHNIFYSFRGRTNSLEKQLEPMVPIAYLVGSVPVFLRKPIATCDFSGSGGWGPDLLSPPPLLDLLTFYESLVLICN